MESKPRIYLAGNIQTGWREKVITNVKQAAIFFDPSVLKGKYDENLRKDLINTITEWLKSADIIFAYNQDELLIRWEILGAEMGYAIGFSDGLSALTKRRPTVILVNEIVGQGWWLEVWADVVLKTLDEGIARLDELIVQRNQPLTA